MRSLNIFDKLDIIILAKLLQQDYINYLKEANKNFNNRYDDIFRKDKDGNKQRRLFFPVEDIKPEDFNTALPDYILNFNLFLKYNTDETLISTNNFIMSIIRLKYGNIYKCWQDIERGIEKNTAQDKLVQPVKLTNFIFYINKNIFPYLRQFKESTKKNINSGYIENNKDQPIRIIKFIEKIKYLISKANEIDSRIIKEFNDCLDEGIKQYNTYSKELVDKKKKNQEYEIVISRLPYDLARMSTGRGWRSCMTLPTEKDSEGGQCHEFVKHDIEKGTLICYFIRKDDHKIESPLGRILLKPYLYMPNYSESFYYFFQRKFYIEERKIEIDKNGKMLENIFLGISNIYKKYPKIIYNIFNYKSKYSSMEYKNANLNADDDNEFAYFFNFQNNREEIYTLDLLNDIHVDIVSAIDKCEEYINGDIENVSQEDQTIYKKIYEYLVNNIFADFKYVINNTEKIINQLKVEYKKFKTETPKDVKPFFVIEPRTYGVFPDKAVSVLEDWVNNTVNKGIDGIYIKDVDLYDDGSPAQIDASNPQHDKKGQGGWDA